MYGRRPRRSLGRRRSGLKLKTQRSLSIKPNAVGFSAYLRGFLAYPLGREALRPTLYNYRGNHNMLRVIRQQMREMRNRHKRYYDPEIDLIGSSVDNG